MQDDAAPPADGARRQILVVAGSGRSGTSLFTGLTGRLGFHIPKPEVSANRSNPRGFGEPRWLVDYHNELLASIDVVIEDGRPEAWELTDKVAERPKALARLEEWLEEQFAENNRIVVKDPRLAWFIQMHRLAAANLDADMYVATMLRHPAEVMRSREIAYGTRTNNTTRVVGWMNMMLGIESRTRDLPRATLRYDDLLSDWRPAMELADSTLALNLFERATDQQVADAHDLVDPSLHRSITSWDDLELPPRVLEITTRAYDSYGRLVGVPSERQSETRAELDAIQSELIAYYDESFDVSRTRTGAFVRREKRKAIRRVRGEMQDDSDTAGPAGLTTLGRRVAGKVRGRFRGESA
jgi:hypothetical protein